jgi:hypothetical protein
MKYPLTETTKEAARYIVNAWVAENVEQGLTITFSLGDDEVHISGVFGASDAFVSPPFAVWRELAKFGLVDIVYTAEAWDVLLLQELRNAVDSDFDVSEYFLTLNAVGNIIINSTVQNAQGTGVNYGEVNQTIEQLADDIEARLPPEWLQTQVDLKNAIDALREGSGDKQSKVGKVISELGRSMEHTAHAVEIIGALIVATPYLHQLLASIR